MAFIWEQLTYLGIIVGFPLVVFGSYRWLPALPMPDLRTTTTPIGCLAILSIVAGSLALLALGAFAFPLVIHEWWAPASVQLQAHSRAHFHEHTHGLLDGMPALAVAAIPFSVLSALAMGIRFWPVAAICVAIVEARPM